MLQVGGGPRNPGGHYTNIKEIGAPAAKYIAIAPKVCAASAPVVGLFPYATLCTQCSMLLLRSS